MKKLSWPSFFIGAGAGFVLGALLLGVAVNYLIRNALSNESTQKLIFGAAVEQVRAGIVNVKQEQESTAVYGKVVSIGGGTVVLEVSRLDGPKEFTFVYDDNTSIVYLANDAASTQVPLSSDEITAGDGLNIMTREPVGSVAGQYAVKIIKI